MHIMNKNKIYTCVFVVVFVLCALLYRDSFSAYFFQDDWFSFSISQAKSPTEFLKFFSPRTDVIYYRPLGMQIPFYVVQTLAGIEPVIFRIATFSLHLLNSILIYRILLFFIRSKFAAIISTSMYALSAVHFTTFYWAATFAFVLGPTWYLVAILSFLKNKQVGYILFFILGLMTNELMITLPAILLLITIMNKKKVSPPIFILSGIVAVFYICIRFLYRPVFDGDYTLGFELISFIKTLRDYILWSFNFPEEVSNQFISFFAFNEEFTKSFVSSISWWTVNIISIIVFAISSLYIEFRNQVRHMPRIMILGILWFMIALSPLLIFREHAYSYYLPIPLVGILIFFASSLNMWLEKFPKQKKMLVFLTLGMLFIFINSSRHTINFNKDVHWAPRRAVIAKKVIQKMQNLYQDLPRDALISVKGNDEYKWALGDQHALQVIYKSDLITTLYQMENESLLEIDNHRPTFYLP